jgi:hypothetical protein
MQELPAPFLREVPVFGAANPVNKPIPPVIFS